MVSLPEIERWRRLHPESVSRVCRWSTLELERGRAVSGSRKRKRVRYVMYSLNGIGTSLYGKRDVEPDGSYVATKWFIFFLLPIFPLGSYRVWRGDTKATATLFLPGVKTEYRMVKSPLNWKQILLTYLVVWSSAIVGFALLIYLVVPESRL